MKVDALVRSLEAVSASASVNFDGVNEFATVARTFGGTKTLASFLPRLEAAAKDSRSGSGASLGSLHHSVDTLAALSNLIGSKAVCGEIGEFRRIVHAYPQVSLLALQAPLSVKASATKKTAAAKKPSDPLRADLVASYKSQISQLRLGSPELTALFEKLAADKKMRPVEMASLASAVAYATAPSTKKPESLRRIRHRHETYLTSAAKGEAIKGASAT